MSHIPKIIIKPINPENHRYSTCGDYVYDREDDTLTIFVSRMDDWRSELAVAIHEAFEGVSCIFDDVSLSAVDLFDMEYEREPQAWRLERAGRRQGCAVSQSSTLALHSLSGRFAPGLNCRGKNTKVT